MKFRHIACGLSLIASFGCGNLPDDESKPTTLVELQGTVQSNSGVLAQDNVRVALIWYTQESRGWAVDAKVQPEFPAGFKLAVTELPPPEFVTGFEDFPNVKTAYGVLVAYTDDNGNGKLDMLDTQSTDYVDHIVAIDHQRMLFFVEAGDPSTIPDLKDENGNFPVKGYNVMVIKSRVNGVLVDGNWVTGSWDGLEWMPVTTSFELAEDTSKDAQQVMCTSSEASGGGGPVQNAPPGVIGPNGAYPDPNDPHLFCDPASPDSYIYSVDTVITERPCYVETSSVSTRYVKQSGSMPAGWPCPAG